MDSGAETVFCANQAMYALIEKLGIRRMRWWAIRRASTRRCCVACGGGGDDEELIRHILAFTKFSTS